MTNSLVAFKGVLAPIPTPFQEDESLYEEGVWNLLEFLSSNGVDGVFSLGSYGSFPLLDVDERLAAMEMISAACKEFSLYNCCHIGAASLSQSIKFLKKAIELRCDSVAAVSPYYYSGHAYRWEEIEYFHKTLIDIGSLPYCIYNNPRTTKFSFTPENIRELALHGASALKDSGNELDRYRSYLEYTCDINFNCMPGSGSTMLECFKLGASSIVAGTSVVFPKEVTNLYKCMAIDRDWQRASHLQKIVSSCRDTQQDKIMRPAAAYILLRDKGVDIGYPRLPWPRNMS